MLVLAKLDKGCCVYKCNMKRQREWKSLLLCNHASKSTVICNAFSLYRNATLQTWVHRNWVLCSSVRDHVPLLSDFFYHGLCQSFRFTKWIFLVIKLHNLPSSYTYTPSLLSRFFLYMWMIGLNLWSPCGMIHASVRVEIIVYSSTGPRSDFSHVWQKVVNEIFIKL